MIRLAALVIVFITVALVPAYSSPRYKIYAEQLLGQLPSKAVIRPDLEKLLNQLASGARIQKGKSAVRPSLLLMQAARAQAVEMILAISLATNPEVATGSKTGLRRLLVMVMVNLAKTRQEIVNRARLMLLRPGDCFSNG